MQHDVVVVTLEDALTRAEQLLASSGDPAAAADVRDRLNELMREDLVRVVEGLTGGTVLAFMAGTEVDPGMVAQVFVLDRRVAASRSARRGRQCGSRHSAGHAGGRRLVARRDRPMGLMVDYQEFLTTVAEFGGLDRDDAERATRATLQTLAERIAEGEARDLAAALPPETAAWLATKTPAERFDLEEFLRRVGERAGVDPTGAERYASAVFAALGRAVSGDEYDDMVAELPRQFDRLLPRGRPGPPAARSTP